MIEQWVDVKGYSDYYQVSSFGNIRSKDRKVTYVHRHGCVTTRDFKGKVLKPICSEKYYPQVVLVDGSGGKKSHRVHRLVLLNFVGEPLEGQETRHLDGNKYNNRLDNLAWGYHSENISDKLQHGTSGVGESNASAVLTEQQAIDIFKLKGTMTIKKTAEQFGVSEGCISGIWHGSNWNHVLHELRSSS